MTGLPSSRCSIFFRTVAAPGLRASTNWLLHRSPADGDDMAPCCIQPLRRGSRQRCQVNCAIAAPVRDSSQPCHARSNGSPRPFEKRRRCRSSLKSLIDRIRHSAAGHERWRRKRSAHDVGFLCILCHRGVFIARPINGNHADVFICVTCPVHLELQHTVIHLACIGKNTQIVQSQECNNLSLPRSIIFALAHRTELPYAAAIC